MNIRMKGDKFTICFSSYKVRSFVTVRIITGALSNNTDKAPSEQQKKWSTPGTSLPLLCVRFVEIDKDNFVNLLLFQNKENTLVG